MKCGSRVFNVRNGSASAAEVAKGVQRASTEIERILAELAGPFIAGISLNGEVTFIDAFQRAREDMIALQTRYPIDDYLGSDELIETDHEKIRRTAVALQGDCDVSTSENVFHFVRDEVSHSWDIQGTRVTRTASEVLEYREGICYAKSHLVAI